MKPTIVGGILAAALGVLVLGPDASPLAQTQQVAPQWYSINVTRVKPDRLDDWLALQRNETMPALQKIGVRERGAWASVFGDGFEYFFATPMANMAERDQPQGPFVRALGQEGARAYNTKLRGMIEGTRTIAIQALPDLSIMPPPSFTPKLAVITFSYVAPGRGPEFENHLKVDVLPAIRKAQPIGYLHSRTVFGGDAGEYVSLRYIDTFAEIDQGPLLTRAVGAAAAAKINAKVAGLVTRQERRIFRFVPDLSFKAKTTS
jgi:hypothetical protein